MNQNLENAIANLRKEIELAINNGELSINRKPIECDFIYLDYATNDDAVHVCLYDDCKYNVELNCRRRGSIDDGAYNQYLQKHLTTLQEQRTMLDEQIKHIQSL